MTLYQNYLRNYRERHAVDDQLRQLRKERARRRPLTSAGRFWIPYLVAFVVIVGAIWVLW